MKTLFYFCIPFVLIFTTQTVFCQTNFLPGYIISNDNDTTYGFIDYRGDERNCKFCVFKITEGKKPITYEPNELKAYRFIDSKYYVSKNILIKDKTTQVFVEYLVDGIVDLFCYRDNQGDHYYLEMIDGRLLVLTIEKEKVFINDEGWFIKTTNKHIGLLKATFADCPEIQPELNDAELSCKSLIKITSDYHNYVCKDSICLVYQKKIPYARIKFAPYIGYGVSKLRFAGDDFYSQIAIGLSHYPLLGVSVNTLIPRINDKISFQLNSEFGKTSYSGSNSIVYSSYLREDNELHISSISFKETFLFKYTYPKGKFRPVLNIGCGVLFNHFSNLERFREIQYWSLLDEYKYDNIPISNTMVGFISGIGGHYYLDDKHIISLEIDYGNFKGQTNFIVTTLQNLSFRVGYYL